MHGILVILLGLLVSGQLFAEPRQWDTLGVAVRKAYNVKWEGTTARADDGSVMFVWTDARSGQNDLFGQLLSPAGEPQWGENGRLLARTEGIGIYSPKITYSLDGWILIWQDLDVYTSGEEIIMRGRMKTQKFLSNGNSVWNDPEQTGIEIYDEQSESLQSVLWVEPDNSGGAFLCWITQTYFYVQRISAEGSFSVNSPRQIAHQNAGWGYAVDAATDGKILVAWKLSNAGQYTIYCRAIGTDCDDVWPNPAILCQQAAYVSDIKLISDGAGGAIIVWLDERLSEIPDVFARRVNSGGQPQWSVNGRFIGTVNGYKYDLSLSPSINADTLDGVLLNWRTDIDDYRHGYIQKFDLNGNIRWLNGVPFCDNIVPSSEQDRINIISDNDGGAVCGWREVQDITGESSFRLSRFAADSAEGMWDECAVTAHEEAHLGFPNIVLGGEGNILSVWIEWWNPEGSMFVHSHDLASGMYIFFTPIGVDDLLDGGAGSISTLSLSNGRTVLTWLDTRELESNHFFQVLDSNGTPLFQEDGVMLADVPIAYAGHRVTLCEDGSGGFFASYTGRPDSSLREVYVTRFNSDLERVGPANGTIVSIEDQFVGHFSKIVSDSLGGAYVAYFRGSDVKLQRVNANCDLVWNEPHTTCSDCDLWGDLIPGSDGSCITITRAQDDDFILYFSATKVSSDGTEDWSVDVTPSDRRVDWLIANSDGSGGCVFAFDYANSGDSSRIYVQTLSADANHGFDAEGLIVTSTFEQSYSPRICVDNQENILVAWLRRASETEDDIFAQKLSPTGTFFWENNGRYIQNANDNAGLRGIHALNYENIYVTWIATPVVTPPTTKQLVYGTHFNSNGVIGNDPFWQVSAGPAICNVLGAEDLVSTETVQGGITMAWKKGRLEEIDCGLYAQRIFDPIPLAQETETVPTEFSLSQNYPNPFNPETMIEFALPVASKATLRVFDVTGREVTTLLDKRVEAGTHRVKFNAQSLASGVYFYKLEAANHSLARKMVLLR